MNNNSNSSSLSRDKSNVLWGIAVVAAGASILIRLWRWTQNGQPVWSELLMPFSMIMFALANLVDPNRTRLRKMVSLAATVLIIASLILTFAGW